jgi:hypothetical protein
MTIVYQDSNYDDETTVIVVESQYALTLTLYDGVYAECRQKVGEMKFCRSAQRACVERARRIVEGKPLPGEMTPGVVL